ncbi:hypothetical protein DL769_000482 [Monosporascus sp. CRB-8-3]|nr:hypothetical protein DL769_000482 [Monosporascus sp. CRB-8-3]
MHPRPDLAESRRLLEYPDEDAPLRQAHAYDEPHDAAADHRHLQIRKAAPQMTEAFPWLAVKVVNEGRGEGSSGLFRTSSCAQFENTFIRRVKDCKDNYLAYSEILESKTSLRVLDGSVLGPRTAFPLSYEESDDGPAPVPAVQINFVRGDLLLNWTCQHNVMEASGLSQAIQLFACAMRGQAFPASAVGWGNRHHKYLIPLLRPDEPALPHSHLRRPRSPTCHSPPPPSWLSRERGARSVMGVPADYMGHMAYIAASFLPLESLAGGCSLPRVASVLRRSPAEASRPHETLAPDSARLNRSDTKMGSTLFMSIDCSRTVLARPVLAGPGQDAVGNDIRPSRY